MKQKLCQGCTKTFLPTTNYQRFCTVVCRKTTLKAEHKLSARKTNIKYKYGLDWDTWMKMYNEQEGKCPICFKFCPIHPESKGEGFAVDHCHTTGEVRSLLCIPCNSAIGQLQENVTIMQNAINYITTHKRERKKK